MKTTLKGSVPDVSTYKNVAMSLKSEKMSQGCDNYFILCATPIADGETMGICKLPVASLLSRIGLKR